MATVATTTSDVSGVDVAGMRSRINNIRSRIAANRTMRAQDVIDLAWIYNTWVQHTHTMYDNTWVAYGNTSPHPSSGSTITSEAVLGVSYYDNIPGPGGVVKATDVTRLVNLVDGILSHTHSLPKANIYTAISAGYNAAAPYTSGMSGLQLDGATVVNGYRSYHLTLFDANGNITSSTNYDLYGDANQATVMANFMNSVPNGTAFVLTTADEPAANHTAGGLPAAATRFGAGSIFTTTGSATGLLAGIVLVGVATAMAYRSAYMLIGHVGQAATFEGYVGTNGSIAVNFKIVNNQFTNFVRLK